LPLHRKVGDVKTAITATTMNTITNNKRIRSLYLAKYIMNAQQANKGTAANMNTGYPIQTRTGRTMECIQRRQKGISI
jgi:hypothetical protein